MQNNIYSQSDKIFRMAIIFSLVIHAGVFIRSSVILIQENKKNQKIKVAYLKNISELKKIVSALKKTEATKAPPKLDNQYLKAPQPNREELLRTAKAMMQQPPPIAKPISLKPDITAVKKKITLPEVDIGKINNPSYLNYYQLVREKIRRAAYQNYSRTETGEVYLSFIVSQDGTLKDVRLFEERSSVSPYLRDIALRSVRGASPFTDFPKELNYPQLSFNVIISFEME